MYALHYDKQILLLLIVWGQYRTHHTRNMTCMYIIVNANMSFSILLLSLLFYYSNVNRVELKITYRCVI